jgi:hypothetical protein
MSLAHRCPTALEPLHGSGTLARQSGVTLSPAGVVCATACGLQCMQLCHVHACTGTIVAG